MGRRITNINSGLTGTGELISALTNANVEAEFLNGNGTHHILLAAFPNGGLCRLDFLLCRLRREMMSKGEDDKGEGPKTRGE